jgi:hypothetical protein
MFNSFTAEARELQQVMKAAFTAGRGPGECERCRRLVPGIGVHDYWPSYHLCPRCVEVLLELKWRPFLPVKDGWYVCADEQEWHRIKMGLQPCPMKGSS